MQIQDPSPLCEECNNSTLNPGTTVKDSADVALGASAPKLEGIVVSKVKERQAVQNFIMRHRKSYSGQFAGQGVFGYWRFRLFLPSNALLVLDLILNRMDNVMQRPFTKTRFS